MNLEIRPREARANLAATALCVLAAVSAATPAASAPPAPETTAAAERFSGLYHGAILYREGGTELEIFVELAAGPDGELVGTLDMPAYADVTYKPLENFAVDGREIYFSYRHDSEVRGPDALFEFEGELSAGGDRLEGRFLESRGPIPFRLQRIGDAGDPRPRMEPRPLDDLSDGGDELRRAFNSHGDAARLVLLLSPT